jgi:hypothetical protein
MTNLDKRVDEIVESLSAQKLVQFGIAQALTFDSHTEWFSEFCEHYDEVSGYIDKVRASFAKKMNKRFMPVVVPQKMSEAYYQVLFLTQLWSNCNIYIDDQTERMLARLALLSEKQSALVNGVSAPPGYGGDIEELLADLLRTKRAIATIREQRFEGRQILFKEYDVKLRVLIAEAEAMVQLYNKILDSIERAQGNKGRLPTDRAGRLPKLDLAGIRLAATKSSDAVVQSLVILAESRTQAALGNKGRATEILVSQLKGNRHRP